MWWKPWRVKHCPHPLHRLRHIHGDERNYGYVMQCMDCGLLYRDWVGSGSEAGDAEGSGHDATRCWSNVSWMIAEYRRKHDDV